MHASYSPAAYPVPPDPAQAAPPDPLAHYITGAFALGSNPPPAAAPAPAPAHAPDNVIRSSDGGVVSGEIGAGRTTSVPPGAVTAPPAPEPQAPPQPKTFPQGKRVLVSAPNGTLHAATVLRFSDDYYEVEIGATKDVVWVPMTHVIPDK
jgi:hypothetical protein